MLVNNSSSPTVMRRRQLGLGHLIFVSQDGRSGAPPCYCSATSTTTIIRVVVQNRVVWNQSGALNQVATLGLRDSRWRLLRLNCRAIADLRPTTQ